MLSEINQRRTNAIWSPLHEESKKAKLIELESRIVVGRACLVGEMGDVG